MGIFDKRVAFKPYEYPEIIKFRDAIKHSRWDVEEFNFDSDAFDFKHKLSNSEKEAIKRTLLAISQIEVSVKTFWADEDGATAIEYGLLASLIAIVTIGAVTGVGYALILKFEAVSDALA
jgi:Flp pilus assembly pilin Flp